MFEDVFSICVLLLVLVLIMNDLKFTCDTYYPSQTRKNHYFLETNITISIITFD